MTSNVPVPARVSQKADTKAFFVLHRAMRNDARRLAASLAAVSPDDSERADLLGRWYQEFRTAIDVHHTTEDRVIFPAVANQAPREFEQIADRLEADHLRLDSLLTELSAGFSMLGDSPSAHAVLRSDVAALIHLLDAHCECEETRIVPLIERVFSASEYAAVDRRAARAHSPRDFLFVAPWILDHTPAAEIPELRASAPLPLRIVARLGSRRYRQLSAVVSELAVAQALDLREAEQRSDLLPEGGPR